MAMIRVKLRRTILTDSHYSDSSLVVDTEPKCAKQLIQKYSSKWKTNIGSKKRSNPVSNINPLNHRHSTNTFKRAYTTKSQRRQSIEGIFNAILLSILSI